jgi:hypothetical protein
MPIARMVLFHEPKLGSSEAEWEDGAGFDPGEPTAGRSPRCVVVDGATEAYDAIRWVSYLVESFLGPSPTGGRPTLTPEDMDQWFGQLQHRWVDEAPDQFGTIFEERKFHEQGSFATFLGCEIRGLDGARPSWAAVALGDTVLFHVRDADVVEQFPKLEPEDFGLNPDGVFTQPASRERMRSRLAFAQGRLRTGDRLYLATDAFAAWMVAEARADGARLWHLVDRLNHPAVFRRLVQACRYDGELKDDDVTLMRVEINESDPSLLVVCQ